MKNCLVLGSGRSGTSMLGGILHQVGYFMGDDLYPPRESNPRGFFESPRINAINEAILAPYDHLATPYLVGHPGGWLARRLGRAHIYNPGRAQRWLAAIPPDVEIRCEDADVLARIADAARRTPFGYKDPRFSYTLPIWLPHLGPDTMFVCIFRQPEITVRSILQECRTMRYLRDLRIDEGIAFEVYRSIYARLLGQRDRLRDRLIFVHYDQFFDGDALQRLSRQLEVDLTPAFVDPSLRRTRRHGVVPDAADRVYLELCREAGASGEARAAP